MSRVLEGTPVPERLMHFFEAMDLVQLRLPADAMKQDVLGELLGLEDELAAELFVQVCARTHNKAIVTSGQQAAQPEDLSFHLFGEGVLVGILLAQGLAELHSVAQTEDDLPA